MFLIVPGTLNDMDQRSKEEVGAIVKARRHELGLTAPDVVSAAGIDPKTYASLEDGTRWPQERTRLRIEPVLQWEAGSIDRLLVSDDPIEGPAPWKMSQALVEISSDGALHYLKLLWSSWRDVALPLIQGASADTGQVRRALLVTADIVADLTALVDPGSERTELLEDIETTVSGLFSERTRERKEDGLESTAQQDAPPAGDEDEKTKVRLANQSDPQARFAAWFDRNDPRKVERPDDQAQ